MTFEKEYPSLVNTPGTLLHVRGNHKHLSESGKTIEMSIERFQDCCLDKQRIREAIDKVLKQYQINIQKHIDGKLNCLPASLETMFKMELGL